MDAIQAIFACKMYKSNPNKSRIASALQDPINKELVKQLRSYLDDEYQTEEYLEPGDHKALEQNAEEPEKVIIPSEEGSSSGSGFSSGSFDDRGTSGDVPGMSVESPDDSDAGVSDVPDDSSVDDADVEESVEVNRKKVTASKDICALKDRLDSLKGLLNSRAELAGVNRILIRENELWIYYDDSVNMNDVMGPVIELLHLSDYSMLEFNRLARSDNAIVFEIIEGTSSVEPEENDEDGKKE